MAENRKHSRQRVTTPIAWRASPEHPRVEGVCLDLSLGGMFIETATPPAFGATIQVFMKLPHMREEAIVTSIVRWTKSTGMGVQFGVMGARETHGITELLGT